MSLSLVQARRERNLLDTRQRVELAEGVEIWLPIAGPAPRILAYLIDLGIRIVVAILFFIVIGIMGGWLGGPVAEGLSMLFAFFMLWFYYVIFEAGRRGATPGKRVMGLRVVQPSGAPITIGQAIVRNFIRAVDFMPFAYGIGLVSVTATRNFQRLGDLAANTFVVYEDRPQAISPALADLEPLPPGIPLTREEQNTLVLFLERAGFWSDARRIELADHLSDLTGAKGAEGVLRLLRMGVWVREAS